VLLLSEIGGGQLIGTMGSRRRIEPLLPFDFLGCVVLSFVDVLCCLVCVLPVSCLCARAIRRYQKRRLGWFEIGCVTCKMTLKGH
jgi:hypothetical protein